MTARSHQTATFAVAPTTYVEKIAPLLPLETYLLSPGDVHLGANNRSAALLEILSAVECQILVLNGDFLEKSKLPYLLRHLSQDDLAVLRLIETRRKSGMRVVYTPGNHDKKVRELLAEVAAYPASEREALSPIERERLDALSLISNWEIVDHFLHEYRGSKFVHVHGDQWDYIVGGDHIGKYFAGLGSFFWDILKRIDREKHQIARFTKRGIKLATRISHKVAAGVIAFARAHGANYAIAGHTHDPWEFSIDGITYVNAGGFDLYESGLITIDTNGAVKLHRVKARRKQIKNERYLAN